MSVGLITIILMIRQTRQLDETLKSQVYQGLIDNSLKIDQLLIERPEYRKYIYENEKFPQNKQNTDELMGVLDFVVDVVDNIKIQEKFIPKKALVGWRLFVQDVLKQPAIKYYMEQKGYWYTGTLVEKGKNSTLSFPRIRGSKQKSGNKSKAKTPLGILHLSAAFSIACATNSEVCA